MKRGLLTLALLLPLLTFGQESKNLAPGEKLNGRVREITYYRTYSIWKGTPGSGERQRLGKDIFDSTGKLLQTSRFGTGEERTTFMIVNGQLQTAVLYFNLDGKPNPALANEFVFSIAEPKQVGLCPNYTTREERGPAENITIEREICPDGSIRRSITTEFTREKKLFAESVEDAKGRSWQTNNHFSADGQYSGFTYAVNDPPRRWRQEVTFSEERLDEQKNWVRCKTTVINLAIPGRISYESIEERQITYF